VYCRIEHRHSLQCLRRIGDAASAPTKVEYRLSYCALPAAARCSEAWAGGELTAQGFRSTFRDWTAEETHHPNHVVEAALAHAITGKVEAAYRRGDLFEKRRLL
jgi:integrase